MEESNPNSSSASSNAGPLVQVTFQKDPNRKKKYLESEPKALGCTQIVLAFFLVNAGLLNWSPGWSTMEIINGIFVIIAGSVAIAAQNLSLHTQVEDHYSAEIKVVMATILGISITLATYCCKVIQCCSPAGFMPVITVNAPPAPEVRREDREGESPNDG
ncbi:uncharacterized protein LOC121690163 isoform X2 [Alosa sapidissima]|uniref:uncharacterized protein LOC121690162 isoform X2 n=1 Tax=Alosa sapidissima TaxID=34773 RepID=UPI001C0A5158|nr:uncharacterized protein LOC121690162 isoform X2 [Alosa sapidissima]XP_041926526.1 uncharacterized protein LOC121690163 isoform X2 [Alosa sapidissima]